MNSLVKVFSNFREFYSEINGATLTGAIDVIVVEQPDGEFMCSPFHVRFGKLGVLRSREKVVDIEINGEPVDIHMKLGESGEAFFVEECPEADVEELPENLATSPIPVTYFSKYIEEKDLEQDKAVGKPIASDEIQLPLPLPRRNSIDFSKESAKDEDVPKFENQVSDFSHRRHTDNTLERRDLSGKVKEFTTQKLRQEWAEHEEIFQFDVTEKEKDWSNSTQSEDKPTGAISTTPAKVDDEIVDEIIAKAEEEKTKEPTITITNTANNTTAADNDTTAKEDTKSKKKRRRKSLMKKKNAQRKSSSSSSLGSNPTHEGGISATQTVEQEADAISTMSISNITNSSSNDDECSPKSGEPLLSALGGDDSALSEKCQTSNIGAIARIPDLDIHFFSDTEVTSITSSGGNGPLGSGRGAGRPSTPIQSDSELEISLREKDVDIDRMSNSASWKWGELPTPDPSEAKECGDGPSAQAQRNSMLSGMFNFMKKTNKMRQHANETGGMYLSDLDADGMDAEVAAMYFPTANMPKDGSRSGVGGANLADDDRESGNGTSLPHSPSSLEGQKSIDSDYEDGGKVPQDAKYLDFVAMSLCGMTEKGEPSDEEFDQQLIKYTDVCANPSLFASPNLVVRLNGKYFSWAAACPIVMTIITFQKPLTADAIDQLTMSKQSDKTKSGGDGAAATAAQTKRSWWYWRRPQEAPGSSGKQSNLKTVKSEGKLADKANDNDQTAVATQTTRPNSPDVSDNTLSKTDSTLNAENTSALVENFDDLSQASSKSGENNLSKSERYKKSLRLSSEAIKKLNLNDGMNEIEFSVTTAYQGTTRCKCYLFRWKHSDKVVISDIDGTITKSDVLGHILPMVGKDWAQLGVAQLFSKIEQNGYKLLYLSARAIGQSRVTREYLRSIRQGDVKLPDGPLLLNPTSLISAFHREVIERKPEQFKIACLSDICDLFPNKDPFYAGYGNRINDVWAYRAVGIPIMRIFTINTKGELKHELTQTFQSSYCSMTSIVDQLFPPIHGDEGSIEYSNFNYWRVPIPELDLDIEGILNTSNNSESSVGVVTTVNAAKQTKGTMVNTKALSSIPEN